MQHVNALAKSILETDGVFMDALLINKLQDVLKLEGSIYEEMLEISDKKMKIIVDGKVSELENITKLEQMLILKLGKLENEREAIIENVARDMRRPSDDINISEIALRLDNSQSKALKETQINILNTINKLKASNEVNARLIKNSLDFIDFSINLYASTGANDSNYSNSGDVSSNKKRNFLDMKL